MLTKNQNKNQKKPLVTNFIRHLLPFGVRSQQGSTLPMAIGLGSAMMIVGTVAVMKGGQESTNTISSEQTKQAMAVAEAGVTNVQSFLAKNPSLAMLDLEDWQEIVKVDPNDPKKVEDKIVSAIPALAEKVEEMKNATNTSSSNGNQESYLCKAAQPSSTSSLDSSLGETFNAEKIIEGLQSVAGVKSNSKDTQWVSVGNNGSYKLLGYSRNASEDGAIAIIQGKVGNAVAQLAIDLQGSFNVEGGTINSESTPIMIDGSGDGAPALWITDNTDNDFGNNDFGGNVKITVSDCKKMVGEKPDENGNFEYQPYKNGPKSKGGTTVLTKEPMPPVPTPPSDAISLSAITGDMTLPRINVRVQGKTISDTKSSDGYYHYKVNVSQGNSINLKGNDTLSINDNVILHLDGNMLLSGNSKIKTDSSEKLQIYGSQNTTSVGINGGGESGNVFIHAPNANAGVNGGGSSYPNISGSIWVKSWGKGWSNSNSGVLVANSGKYADYLSGETRQKPKSSTPEPITTTYDNVGKVSNFTRQPVSSNK
ncbi:hypothetical protein VKI22_15050 [Cyanobacterium aponinum UTEX 3221]|uniref:hypothetical protein n=1 Tax=Cyanobacterium aponinum TaxID=379064 RepID=UPI002B4BAE3D|nr:hypothetical protein [Cyanobacterium aponinum]WRL37918.1 hypothetical protein VKI22_15050 [Cyanobacterium aponinum UTEX 3221]